MENTNQSENKLSYLQSFLAKVQENDLFDQEDANAIQEEIDRLENNKTLQYTRRCEERLKIIAEFAQQVNLQEDHVQLHDYFLQKHQAMQELIAKMK